MGIFGAAFVSGLALTALRRMPWWWAAASAGAALAWRNAAQKKLQRQRLLEEEASATHSAEPEPDLPELDTHLVQRWSAAYFSAPAESPAPLEFASDIEVPTPAIELASEVTHDLQPAAHPPIEAPRPPSPWVLSVEPVPAWQDQPPAAADSRSSDLLARAPEGVEERGTDVFFERRAVADGCAHALERADDGIDDTGRGVTERAVKIEKYIIVFFHRNSLEGKRL